MNVQKYLVINKIDVTQAWHVQTHAKPFGPSGFKEVGRRGENADHGTAATAFSPQAAGQAR